jgi:hypothetical protein
MDPNLKNINHKVNIIKNKINGNENENGNGLENQNTTNTTNISNTIGFDYLEKAKDEVLNKNDYIYGEYFLNLALMQELSIFDTVRGLAMKSFIHSKSPTGESEILLYVGFILKQILNNTNDKLTFDKEKISSFIRAYFRIIDLIDKSRNDLNFFSSIISKDTNLIINNYCIEKNVIVFAKVEESITYKIDNEVKKIDNYLASRIEAKFPNRRTKENCYSVKTIFRRRRV